MAQRRAAIPSSATQARGGVRCSALYKSRNVCQATVAFSPATLALLPIMAPYMQCEWDYEPSCEIPGNSSATRDRVARETADLALFRA